MAANKKTSLSAGEAIRAILTSDEDVMKLANDVFPVISEESARLPYIVYRRSNMETVAAMNRAPADTLNVEVLCYTEHYGDSVTLAEAVRAALDNRFYEDGDLYMRSCCLTDSEEGFVGDAYEQRLVFTIKI